MISGRQAPNHMGPNEPANPLAVVLLYKLPLYESYESKAREGPVFFQMSKCVFPSVSEVPGGFLEFLENHDFSPRIGQTNLPKLVCTCPSATRLGIHPRAGDFGEKKLNYFVYLQKFMILNHSKL